MSHAISANAESSTSEPQRSRPQLYLVDPDPTTQAPAAAGAESGQFGWILHPAIDLLFCCGGLVWLLFAFHYFFVAPSHNETLVSALSLLVILGTHVLSETHTSATLFRAYRTRETRERYAL